MRHPKANDDDRQSFQERLAAHEAAGKAIVYIDESGFAHDMPRTHGYAPRGKRCVGVHDWQAKGRINVIGALLAGTLLTVGLTTCNVDADIFNLWLKDQLIPVLAKGSVLVMDRASFHRRSDTINIITDAEHILEYLPAYSPDYNPIEHTWAQAKAHRRKTGETAEQIFSIQKWNQS